MNSGLFGDGSLRLDWSGIGARPGLAPELALKGRLAARGYGIGAVAQVTVEVTAWDIAGTYAYLGTTAPKSWVLNWVRQHHVQSNPAPADEATWDVEVFVPMTPAIIEGLEDRRQGRDFSLMLDTSVLLVDRGEATGPRAPVHYATSPTWTAQDRLAVTQHEWGAVLERWERGVEVVVVVPIAAVEPNPQRADVVRHLKQARQRIEGGDYFGSFAEARKALELLRGLSQAATPLPKDVKERDPLQRIHSVIDALFNLASACLHTDPAVRDFVPTRADAVAVVAGSASVSQQVFASLDRP
ncbi:hypothetical protein [Blastococcus sp. URHD0036]|uniref:hypothetical protein n=1 Tax=Blastococcus sp. URHD0036 TaxID=1380356 RepID=UPI0004972DDA|nr:hypothetical protein [Blastococcus sp. URHD0036]